MDGILAFSDDQVQGFLLYLKEGATCEIIVFEVFKKFQGLGTFLLNELVAKAKELGCKKVILQTTNDNLDALRFYQRRGFTIAGVSLNAVEIARKMKPSISNIGDYSIPVRDEIILERNI